MFDPNRGDHSSGSLDLCVRGIANDGGSVLAGHTNDRAWLAAMEPDGTVRPASNPEDTSVRALGTTTVEGTLALYGNEGTPNEAGENPRLARV